MRPGASFAVCLAALWLAAALQVSLANRISIGPASPDFLLILVGAVSMYATRRWAAVLGFAAGLFQGALSGANLMHYVASRTLGGFLVAWSRDLNLERHFLWVLVAGFLLTLCAQLVWMFLAAPPDIPAFLGATILSGLYNGVLLLPSHAIVKRVVKPEFR